VRSVAYKVAMGLFVLEFLVILPMLLTHYLHVGLTRTNLTKSGDLPKKGCSVGYRGLEMYSHFWFVSTGRPVAPAVSSRPRRNGGPGSIPH
jgi:hypothetical protein